MFKAKLIANPAFIFFRKHSLLLFFLLATLNSIVINILLKEEFEVSMLLFTFPVYLLLFYLAFKVGGKVVNSVQDRHIELDSESLRIINKKRETDLTIMTSSIESVVLQKEYKYEESFVKELRNQLKGISNYHFIQIHSGDNWYTLRFMLDSHYMETKLNGIIQDWITAGIPIRYSDNPMSIMPSLHDA